MNTGVRTVCIGCKDFRPWVKDLDLPPFLSSLAATYGIMAANFVKMTSNQGLSPAAKVSFIRNRGNFHLQVKGFAM